MKKKLIYIGVAYLTDYLQLLQIIFESYSQVPGLFFMLMMICNFVRGYRWFFILLLMLIFCSYCLSSLLLLFSRNCCCYRLYCWCWLLDSFYCCCCYRCWCDFCIDFRSIVIVGVVVDDGFIVVVVVVVVGVVSYGIVVCCCCWLVA